MQVRVLLVLTLLLAPIATTIACAQGPPSVACWNETFISTVRLESRLLGYIRPCEAHAFKMHAEAGQYYVGCKADASLEAGPVRIAVENEVEQGLTKTVHVYLRVYENGKKVYEKKLRDIGWLDGKFQFNFAIVLEYHDNGVLEYSVSGEGIHYHGSVEVGNDQIPVFAAAEENGVCAGKACVIRCVSYVKPDKKWNICSGQKPAITPGEGVGEEPSDDDINIDVGGVINKVVLAMIGVAALFALPLFIAALRNRVAAIIILLVVAGLLGALTVHAAQVRLGYGQNEFCLKPGEYMEFSLRGTVFSEDGVSMSDYLITTAAIWSSVAKVRLALGFWADPAKLVFEVSQTEPYGKTLFKKAFSVVKGVVNKVVRVRVEYLNEHKAVVRVKGDFVDKTYWFNPSGGYVHVKLYWVSSVESLTPNFKIVIGKLPVTSENRSLKTGAVYIAAGVAALLLSAFLLRMGVER